MNPLQNQPFLVDTHAHLDRLDDTSQALAAARAAGIGHILAIGMDPQTIDDAFAIAAQNPGMIRVAAGLHPHLADQVEELWDEVASRARAGASATQSAASDTKLRSHGMKTAAIGETGFDRFRAYSSSPNQHDAFQRHCALARELDLPLIIHSRAAERETLDALEQHASDLTVVLHCFALPEQLDEVVERGYLCSFAGNITYPSATALREAAARIPLDRLLVETDAPYLSPVPFRGERNHPALVRHTFDTLCEATGADPTELAATMLRTAQQTFGFE